MTLYFWGGGGRGHFNFFQDGVKCHFIYFWGEEGVVWIIVLCVCWNFIFFCFKHSFTHSHNVNVGRCAFLFWAKTCS